MTGDEAALVRAVEAHDVEAARALLERGISPDLKTGKWRRPLLGRPLPPPLVRLLLEHGANPNHRDRLGRTPLFAQTDVESLRLLLDAGADPDAVDARGENALFGAVGFYGGLPEAVRLLAEAGADVRRRNAQGESLADVARAGVTSALEHTIAWEIMAYLRGRGLDA